MKEEDFTLEDKQTLRRKGYVSVEKQKTTGRFWYKTKTFTLRLIGIILLFFTFKIILLYTYINNKKYNKFKRTSHNKLESGKSKNHKD